MEGEKGKTGHYDALIWLLMTEYKDKQYTPSDYILEALQPHIDKARGSTLLEVHDSTVYDFTVAQGFSHYWDHFIETSARFSNSLILISYSHEKYIPRDCYMAGLAKLYTCWDTAYINCADKGKIRSSAFDFVVGSDELPDTLTRIIEKSC